MREYTGDRIIDTIRRGYASQPDATGIPTEPDINSYLKGVLPLETLPAPWWNWFIQLFTDNIGRAGGAITDFYEAIDFIMNDAEALYTNDPSDLFNALSTLWNRDITSTANTLNTSISALQGRATALEGRATALESRATDIETLNTTQDGRLTSLETRVTTNEGDITQLETDTADLRYDLDAYVGIGGWLNAYNFSTPTPSQQDITNYALTQIPSINNASDIWNGTKVSNLFDGNVWVLTNTPNTNPVVFEWTIMGLGGGITTPFMPDIMGLIKGGNSNSPDGTIMANQDGTGYVKGDIPDIKSRLSTVETGVSVLVGEVGALETWKNGLAASNFGITGAWTCPTPSLP